MFHISIFRCVCQLLNTSSKYDEESKEILEKYCEQKKVKKGTAARIAVKKLKDDLEE